MEFGTGCVSVQGSQLLGCPKIPCKIKEYRGDYRGVLRFLDKPGAHRPQASMRLVSRNHFRAAEVCVCVHSQGRK